MLFDSAPLHGLVIISPRKFEDSRGYFVETFRQTLFEEGVGKFAFVQDNESHSVQAGTVRGLHFQLEPKAQGKLVRCIAGALLDVAVDLRKGSPTFGRHFAIELSV